MNTQRHKKRNAQFKRKHHEVKGREGGPKKGQGAAKPPVDGQAQSRDPGPTLPQSSTLPPPVSDAATADQRYPREKQYSRRKVLSNWDRYSEEGGVDGGRGDPESEEDLEQRLVQLLNLPPAGPQATGTLPGAEGSYPSPTPPSFLSLDCDALAATLASLPLHRKLDISLEILSLAEDTPREEDALRHSSLVEKTSPFDFPSPASFGLRSTGGPLVKGSPLGLYRPSRQTSSKADESLQRTEPLQCLGVHPSVATASALHTEPGLSAPTSGEKTDDLDDILDELLA